MTATTEGDPKIEKWLADHHVTWSYNPQLPLASIDIKRSLGNQARPDQALDDDLVELYAGGYAKGDPFPPIVVRKTSRGAKKVVVLDGNHRTNGAIRNGTKTHPAYVVECADEAAMMLMYDANLKNGANLTRRQRIALAVHLIETGMAARDASKQMGVTEAEVSNARTLNRASIRARSLDVHGWDNLPQSQRLDLARLKSDPVFAGTARLTQQAGLQGQGFQELLRRVKATKSDDAALKFLDSEYETRRADIQKRYGGKVTKQRAKTTEYTRLAALLHALEAIDPAQVDESAPTAEARRVMRKELAKAGKRIIAVDKAIS